MILAAHAIAISCYLGAVVITTVPFARSVRAPVTGVALALAAGLVAHATGLLALARDGGATAVTGLGPSLSFAGFAVAAALLVVELLAREGTLTLAAAAGNGRRLGVVDAASYLFGVEDAVQREPGVAGIPSHTDDSGRNFRITNPGTDE